MTGQDPAPTAPRPAGYAALATRYELDVIPNWHRSLVAHGNTHRLVSVGAKVEETYPASYWPGDSLGDQLEFALKYDGTNLGILASVFAAAGGNESGEEMTRSLTIRLDGPPMPWKRTITGRKGRRITPKEMRAEKRRIAVAGMAASA